MNKYIKNDNAMIKIIQKVEATREQTEKEETINMMGRSGLESQNQRAMMKDKSEWRKTADEVQKHITYMLQIES